MSLSLKYPRIPFLDTHYIVVHELLITTIAELLLENFTTFSIFEHRYCICL